MKSAHDQGIGTRLEAAQAAADNQRLLDFGQFRRLAELIVVARLRLSRGRLAACPFLCEFAFLGFCGPAALSVATEIRPLSAVGNGVLPSIRTGETRDNRFSKHTDDTGRSCNCPCCTREHVEVTHPWAAICRRGSSGSCETRLHI